MSSIYYLCNTNKRKIYLKRIGEISLNIVISLIKMIGGLVLLIYGMNILSTNLKKIAGDKLKAILKKATDNVFKGILTGIIITVSVQSSAVVTVMVVGFVNAEILKMLYQLLWEQI